MSPPSIVCWSEGLSYPALRLRPFWNQQQQSAGDDGGDARPQRHIDRLLFLHRELDGTEIHFVGCFGVAELPVNDPEDSGHDQDNGYDFDTTHISSARERWFPIPHTIRSRTFVSSWSMEVASLSYASASLIRSWVLLRFAS